MKRVLDPCCGSRMFWFDPVDQGVLFGDIRQESHTLCDGRTLQIKPDMQMDFRDMPFDDGRFKLVVFDPPHLRKAGDTSWIKAKYGSLSEDWRNDLRRGFAECFRVLANDGVLIFKWNEIQIKVKEVLALTPEKPLFGHKSGKRADTHWICFMKRAIADNKSPGRTMNELNIEQVHGITAPTDKTSIPIDKSLIQVDSKARLQACQDEPVDKPSLTTASKEDGNVSDRG